MPQPQKVVAQRHDFIFSIVGGSVDGAQKISQDSNEGSQESPVTRESEDSLSGLSPAQRIRANMIERSNANERVGKFSKASEALKRMVSKANVETSTGRRGIEKEVVGKDSNEIRESESKGVVSAKVPNRGTPPLGEKRATQAKPSARQIREDKVKGRVTKGKAKG